MPEESVRVAPTDSRASAWKLGGLGVTELGRRVIAEIRDDDCLGRAAQLAYYFLFALFPFFLFLTTLLGYLPIPDLLDRLLEMLGQMLPAEGLRLVQDNIRQLVTGQRGGLLSFGIPGSAVDLLQRPHRHHRQPQPSLRRGGRPPLLEGAADRHGDHHRAIHLYCGSARAPDLWSAARPLGRRSGRPRASVRGDLEPCALACHPGLTGCSHRPPLLLRPRCRAGVDVDHPGIPPVPCWAGSWRRWGLHFMSITSDPIMRPMAVSAPSLCCSPGCM